MSDKPYVKECSFCKQKIRMSKQSGEWKPYSLDNEPHDCRATNGNGKQEVTLQQVQKKLQDFGITINLEKLMAK